MRLFDVTANTLVLAGLVYSAAATTTASIPINLVPAVPAAELLPVSVRPSRYHIVNPAEKIALATPAPLAPPIMLPPAILITQKSCPAGVEKCLPTNATTLATITKPHYVITELASSITQLTKQLPFPLCSFDLSKGQYVCPLPTPTAIAVSTPIAVPTVKAISTPVAIPTISAPIAIPTTVKGISTPIAVPTLKAISTPVAIPTPKLPPICSFDLKLGEYVCPGVKATEPFEIHLPMSKGVGAAATSADVTSVVLPSTMKTLASVTSVGV